ncbi:MAG: T9SS type A sorting domain-containing protein [Bacteroidetes bacterium]|nr:T9SS type A sorting domain-containing protein [Bacteroidota bacterium]
MKHLFTTLALALCLNANAQFINTLAGTGISGYGGDGGLAITAKFHQPYKICTDMVGNVYVADCLNHRVRKIDVNGIITTIAGTGTGGFSGDGGLAISAELNYPSGVCIDATGNIYIADGYNNRIRKIDPNGIINTIAGSGAIGYGNGSFSGDGGQATSATFNLPVNMVVDAIGNMFIADAENYRVRKVDINGIISTVAGNGTAGYSGDGGQATSASLTYPIDITTDASGNILIADIDSYRVRKVNTIGVITTIAGTGSSNYSGDGGLATLAEIGEPIDVDVDATGNIYITDVANCCIRKIDANGVITTIAGTGTPGHTGDGGLATAAEILFPGGMDYKNGVFYITELFGHSIRMICSNMENTSTSNTVCVGNSATLTASGANTYMWSTLETGASIVVSPSVNTNYYVQGRDNEGCVYNSRINVIVKPQPTISVSGNTNICIYDTLTLTASGVDTYTWSTLETGMSITVSPTVSTVYDVYGTNNFGCQTNSQIFVSVSPCTGVDELENGNDELRIYPNPANEILNVELEMKNEKQIEIFVYDVLGNTVIYYSEFNIHHSIEVRGLKSGMYFVRVGNVTQKFVIAR